MGVWVYDRADSLSTHLAKVSGVVKKKMKWKTKDYLTKASFILFLIVWGTAIGYFFSNCQDTPVINF